MTKLAVNTIVKPLKVKTVRIEDIFEHVNYHADSDERIIKDYVYYPQKRVIA